MSRLTTIAAFATAFAVAPLAASAQASDPAAQAPATQAAPQAEADLDRRVCKPILATGSRLGKRKICKTQREWLREMEADRQSLSRMQSQKPLKGN